MPKKIISYILSFILLVALILSITIGIFAQTILKEKYMLKVLEKSDYYSIIYDDIMENFENNTIQSGLTEEVFDGIITKDKVYNDVNTLITYLYNDVDELEIDTESIEEALKENIAKQIEENNKTITDDEQEEIDEYVKKIIEIYKNAITYSEGYLQTIQTVITEATAIVNKAQITAYAVTVLIILILIFLNNMGSLKYISISLIATGILYIIIKIVEISSLDVNNILMFNQAFSNLIVNLTKGLLNNFLVFGIIAFVLGMGLNLLSSSGKLNNQQS